MGAVVEFSCVQLLFSRLAAVQLALLEAIMTQILRRRVVGITVIIVIPHVIHPGGTCTATKVLWCAEITLSVKPNLSLDKGIDISRAVLKELVWMARFALEYYNGNIDGTQDAEFVCFFEKASFAL